MLCRVLVLIAIATGPIAAPASAGEPNGAPRDARWEAFINLKLELLGGGDGAQAARAASIPGA